MVALRVDQANEAMAAPVEPLLALSQDLKDLQASLFVNAVGVVGDVAHQLDGLTTDRLAEVQAALVLPVQPLTDLLVNLQEVHETLQVSATTVVDGVSAQLTTRLEAMVDERLSRASAELTANADAMTTAFDVVVAKAVEQMSAATEQLDAASSRVEQGVRQAGLAAETAFTGFTDNLVAAGLETLEGIEHAGRSLLAKLDRQVEGFLATLTQNLELQTDRDLQVETELNDRVRQLVDRTDLGVRRLSDRLRKETDRLAQRDEEQEHLRADSFVNALETLLAQTDGRSPLRSRIMDVLGSERRKREEPRPPAGPEVTPALDELEEADHPAPTTPVQVRPAPAALPVRTPARRPAATKPAITKPAATKPRVAKAVVTKAVAPKAVAVKSAPAKPAATKAAVSKAAAPKVTAPKVTAPKAPAKAPAKVVAARKTAAPPVTVEPA